MNNLDLVREFMRSIENKDFRRVSELMDDRFKFVGPTPEPTDKEGFLAIHRALLAGLSDFKYNVTNLTADGDVAMGDIQITAKHTGPLDLSFMNLPKVEATNKTIKLPKESFTSRIVDHKVIDLKSNTPKDGGVMGMLKQIGVEVPKKQAAH